MENAQIHIGEYEVFASYSLLIPGDDALSIALSIEGIPVELEIRFQDTSSDEEQEKSTISLAAEGKVVTLTFHNWNNPLGTALTKIEPLFHLGERKTISFLAKNKRIGELNDFAIHLLRGKAEAHAR